MQIGRVLSNKVAICWHKMKVISRNGTQVLGKPFALEQPKQWLIKLKKIIHPPNDNCEKPQLQKLFSVNLIWSIFRKVSIARQIAAAVLSVIACYIGISGYSYFQLTKIDNSYNELLHKSVKMVSAAETSAWYLSQSAAAMRGYLLTMDQNLLTLYPVYSAKIDDSVETMGKIAVDPVVKGYAKQIEDSKNAYSATVYAMQQFQRENNKEAFSNEFSKSNIAIDRAIEAAEAIIKIEEEQLRIKSRKNSALSSRIKMQLIWVNIIALLVGLGLALLISRKISRPIQSIASTTQKIASGDLRVANIAFDSQCEVGDLGRSTNQMLAGLRSIIQRINNSAEQVATASELLSHSAHEVSTAATRVTTTVHNVAQGTDEQLAVVKRAMTITDDITGGVEHISENAHTVAMLSQTTADMAQRGRRSVDHAVQYLQEVSRKVEQTTEQTFSLGEASKQVSQISGMITAIAGQTNLLALNAAIEAARAGDAGRGFAVVANEVRKLAEQSRESAQNIGQIINTIEQRISGITSEMSARNQELAKGVGFTTDASCAFEEIVAKIENLSVEINSIRDTATVLNQNGSTVRSAMASIAEVARTNSLGAVEISSTSEEQTASVEEMAASTHELANLAADLQKLVLQFKYQ